MFLFVPTMGIDTEYRCLFFVWLNRAIYLGKGKKGEYTMEVRSIEVIIDIQYEPTYVYGITQHTRCNRNFFINEEKYEKILKILEE